MSGNCGMHPAACTCTEAAADPVKEASTYALEISPHFDVPGRSNAAGAGWARPFFADPEATAPRPLRSISAELAASD
eukprot:3076236-Pleurochrysis_carterae.AAC.1